MVARCGSGSARHHRWLLVLATCTLGCWSVVERFADTSDGRDGGTDGEVEPDRVVGPDADGEVDSDAGGEAPGVDADADNDVADLPDAPEDDGDGASSVPCAADEECSAAGLVCNESWGICVVSSCIGEPDFTPCELVTAPSDRAYEICVGEACVSPGCGDVTCNPPGSNWALPDTNQRFCMGRITGTPCPGTPGTDECAATPYCGQDAQYGWDVAHAATERFARAGGDEPIVTDNVTGLIWQGCLAGQMGATCEGFGADYTWEDALWYCDSLSCGGFADWRLPDRHELQSIVDYGATGTSSAIDPVAFPATMNEYVWSSSTSARSDSNAWFVDFGEGRLNDGRATGMRKTDPQLVRCVRRTVADARADGARFTRTAPVAEELVVADGATGLVWQGCASGQTGPDCTGSGPRHAWEPALRYCEGLLWGAYTDWYLPSVRELASIVDDHRASPSIDTTAFPATPGDPATTWDQFWSSSSVVSRDCRSPPCDYAWMVDFYTGEVVAEDKDGGLLVRCVRRGR